MLGTLVSSMAGHMLESLAVSLPCIAGLGLLTPGLQEKHVLDVTRVYFTKFSVSLANCSDSG